jgi:hypothetical protein
MKKAKLGISLTDNHKTNIGLAISDQNYLSLLT